MLATISKCLAVVGKASCYTDADLGLLYLCRKYADRNVKKYLRNNVELATYTEILPPHGTIYGDPDLMAFEKIGNQMVAYAHTPSGYKHPRALQLEQTPLRAVASVYETWTPGGGFNPPPGSLLDPSLYVPDYDFGPDPTNSNYGISYTGIVWKYWTIWPAIVRSMQITYTAGWTPAELRDKYPEFEEAVVMTTVKGFRTMRAYQDQQLGFGGTGPLGSESIESVSRSYNATAVQMTVGQATVLTKEVMDLLEIHVNYSRRI